MLNPLLHRQAAPEPLSQEVLERIAREYPEPERAGVTQALLAYRAAPVNLGRLCVLDAVKGVASDVPRFVEVGNRSGLGRAWEDGPAPAKRDRDGYICPICRRRGLSAPEMAGVWSPAHGGYVPHICRECVQRQHAEWDAASSPGPAGEA